MKRTKRGKGGGSHAAAVRKYRALLEIEQLAAQAGVNRGLDNEQRAIGAFRAYMASEPNSPPWLIGVRPATSEEQPRKIDIVVQTDGPELYIQIKSSTGFARLHQMEQRKRWHQGLRTLIVGVVVVNIHMTDHDIGRSMMQEISALRRIVANLGSCYLPLAEITDDLTEESA